MKLDQMDWANESSLKYHLTQWKEPKQSTLAFAEFINQFLVGSKSVIDLGCGTGAATGFLAKQFDEIQWIGLDSNQTLIAIAREMTENSDIKNLRFTQGDFVSSPINLSCSGAVSLQTLSWVPDFDQALTNILTTLQPAWFAFSSLFYAGDISAITKVYLHKTNEVVHYNTISLPQVTRLAAGVGYQVIEYVPFDIPISLPQPSNWDSMGTYTLNVVENENRGLRKIQISGPVLMSWYNVCLMKIH